MKCVLSLLTALVLAAPAMAQQPAGAPAGAPAAAPQGGGRQGGAANIELQWNDAIPAGNADHAARALRESPRHGEFVDIKLKDGSNMKAWVVYPERATKSAVVIVIHDINGLRDIPRAFGDQVAQDGYIAIVPDFLSGMGMTGTESYGTGVNQAVQGQNMADVVARLDAAMAYGKSLASSNGKTGIVGFCAGGARSFAYAAAQPNIEAAVVYYGEAPGSAVANVGVDVIAKNLANVKAPVLGFYGGNDMRIDATLPVTEAAMKQLGKFYETHIFEGAGHGFMGNQAGMGGANLRAAEQSWPMVLAFWNKYLN